MICPPCAEAADFEAAFENDDSHDPNICRDQALGVHGCTCAHGQRPARPATP